MRRTYRSRKDEGGFNRNHLISGIDATSVFDAFYIQSLKQSKKELSSVGYQSKVRKRKYVKRIVGNASKIRENTCEDGPSRSEYLTPDKSIHVKREFDPFDLLLRSSPAVINSPVLCPRFSQKKCKKIIKLNCSDDESTVSDKENVSELGAHEMSTNTTNFNSYKLTIECENIDKPDRLDDSIARIVNKMSLLKNITQRRRLGSAQNVHRLTVTSDTKSLELNNLPLCSTPLQEKYRNGPLDNFSPITMSFRGSPETFEDNLYEGGVSKIINYNEDQTFVDSTKGTQLLLPLNSLKKSFTNGPKKQCSVEDMQSHQTAELSASGPTPATGVTHESSFSSSEIIPFHGFNHSLNNTEKKDEINYLGETTLINESIRKNEHSDRYSYCSTGCGAGTPPTSCAEDRGNATEKEISHWESLYNTCSSNESKLNLSGSTALITEADPDIKLCNVDKDSDTVSFVTIRRKNRITKKSVIYISDTSKTSVSSSEENMNIIANNIDELCEDCSKCSESKTGFVEDKNVLTLPDTNCEVEIVDKKCPIQSTTVNESHKADVASSDCSFHIETDVTKSERESRGEAKVPVVLQPGKKWERSLCIYKRMTTMADCIENSLLDNESTERKGRKYRQSVITMMEMQKFRGPLHNESINGRRSTFVCKPSRSTIKIVKENNYSRHSICSSTISEDLKGLVSDDCDDTIIDLSKLSIDESVREVTVLEQQQQQQQQLDASRASAARDYLLRRCGQTDVLPFDECYPDTELKNCHKIGEGVYGEVFLWRARDGRARVLKVVPIAGDTRVNGEPQKGYHEIVSEVVIAMELSALRAPIAEIEQRLDEGEEVDASFLHSVQNATDVFNEVVATRCVRGPYPARLLELWELYDECRGSENDCPAALPARQHYLVLELRNAGQDLESYCFANAEQAHALFLQLALALAVAEEALQFEHRDLHWGNVLVSPTEQKLATFVVRGRAVRVARRGVACAVIDYSLSRLTLAGAALYSDLAADDTLFEAVGDRQFTVYRLMRDRLGNEWKNFEPYTNVLWLDYVADKMVTALRYKRTSTKVHKHYIAKLKAIKGRILDYGSAAQFVLTDNEF